jgi:transcription termination factor Rho
MTQSADQPVLEAQSGSDSPTPKRRRATTTAAKPRKTAVASAETASVEAAPAKPRARRVAKKTEAVESTQELPGLEKANGNGDSAKHDGVEISNGHEAPKPVKKPAVRRNRPAAKAGVSSPVTVPEDAGRAVEEWSPTRVETSAPPAPVAAPAPPAPVAQAPVQAENRPPAEAPAPARKYPVYIPRHVAKQLEEQGHTAPIAVTADTNSESARVAMEAAQAAQAAMAPVARQERPERQERHDRHDRHGRHDRRDQRDGRDQRDNRHNQNQNFQQDREPQEPPADEQLGEELGSGEGVVEISGKGFGFIRDYKRGFTPHPQDIFVTPELVRKYNLRDGQWLKGDTRRSSRGSQLCRVAEVNGGAPELARTLPAFDELTVVSPMERITLETTPERTTTRVIDLFAPIGKGQRGIIVAPPRTGKTTLLQHIADAVVKKHPEIKLIILLIDERPEEVTDIRRTVPHAEVMASSNDMDVKSHTRVAQLAIERAKRLVESGQDVFVLLDSITRVGRAFNNASTGGRTGSGGLDNRALEIPRRLFAAARNTEEAGSLTIVATALIETGSLMDDRIFQEFKGTGNMELVLDRKISDQRIYPAIDIFQSGTRREELLIPADDLHKISLIRRGLAGHKPMEAIERLLFFLKKFPTNAQMLAGIPG